MTTIPIAVKVTDSGGATASATVNATTTSSTGFPDASNTGWAPTGVTLTPHSGALNITVASSVVDSLDVAGNVVISANNVTLKRSRVTSNSGYVVYTSPGHTGTVIQDCEINGVGANNSGNNGVAGGSTTVLRCNIYNVENGISPQSNGWLIQDNYIHSLLASGSPHYDGIQVDGGMSNIDIEHNTVINDYGQTSAVMLDNYFGPLSNVTVNNNYLKGGGYTIYCSAQFGGSGGGTGGAITNVKIINNTCGKGQWGYTDFAATSPPPTWTGNVDAVTHAPI